MYKNQKKKQSDKQIPLMTDYFQTYIKKKSYSFCIHVWIACYETKIMEEKNNCKKMSMLYKHIVFVTKYLTFPRGNET